MRLTIARKLYAGFLAVLALMVVLGLVGMSGLNSAREHSNDMYTHAVVPVVDLGKARAQTNESQKIVSDHILESSDAGRAELEDTLAANSKRANTQLQAVAKTIETPEERAAIANLQKSLPAYRDAREKVLELSRQDRDAEAYALSTQALSPLADEAAASFEELYDSKVKLAETQKQAIVDEASKGRTQAILLMLLGLAIGLGIAWLVARGIVRAVKQVLAATDGIAAGDVDQKLEVKSRDELGDVAEATQRMVDYVKEIVGPRRPYRRGRPDSRGRAQESAVTRLAMPSPRWSATCASWSAASEARRGRCQRPLTRWPPPRRRRARPSARSRQPSATSPRAPSAR